MFVCVCMCEYRRPPVPRLGAAACLLPLLARQVEEPHDVLSLLTEVVGREEVLDLRVELRERRHRGEQLRAAEL